MHYEFDSYLTQRPYVKQNFLQVEADVKIEQALFDAKSSGGLDSDFSERELLPREPLYPTSLIVKSTPYGNGVIETVVMRDVGGRIRSSELWI